MANQKTKPSGSNPLIFLGLIAAMGLGALAYYISNNPSTQTIPMEYRRTRSSAQLKPIHKGPNVEVTTSTAKVGGPLVASIVGDQVLLKPFSGQAPPGAEPKLLALQETINGFKLNDVRILGVDVQARNALVEITPAIHDGMGSMQEAKFLEALQRVMGQFPDVDKVQIMVDGKPLDSLGHFETADPMPVIRPGESGAVPATPILKPGVSTKTP